MTTAIQAPDPAVSESDWVEGELIRSLMPPPRSAQYLALLLVLLMIGVLYDDVPPAIMVLWTGCMLAVSFYQLWVIRYYGRHMAQAGTAAQLQFMARYGFSWPLSAFVWGMSGMLHYDRASLTDQFVCWLILAGLGMMSINSLSPHLKTMRGYLNTLALTMLGVMAWRMGMDLEFDGPPFHYWLVILLVLYWQILLQAGERLHQTHRRNFELQYRNSQLIESLTRQTLAALEAVEIKNRFLASAAHDIRQPVHALGLYADWLSSEPELVNEIAPKIVKSTRAVNALFDSLFDLVRLDSGQVRVRVERVNVARLLHDLELQYRPLAEAKGLELRLRVSPGHAETDPIQLQRIVGNLISNAVKYTERGGILLAARTTPKGVRIEVWDTGVGIPPEYQQHIFHEFFKVPAHAGTEDSFGLGLHIVSRLCGILGHTLSLVSRPGRGTVFRLLLSEISEAQAGTRAADS
jgi:signal transduction histidine kinase